MRPDTPFFTTRREKTRRSCASGHPRAAPRLVAHVIVPLAPLIIAASLVGAANRDERKLSPSGTEGEVPVNNPLIISRQIAPARAWIIYEEMERKTRKEVLSQNVEKRDLVSASLSFYAGKV